MGDYCTMRLKARLNLAGAVIVGRLIKGLTWEDIRVAFPSFPLHSAFMRDYRNNAIHRGGLQFVPPGWEEGNRNELSHAIWTLQSSVKTTSTVELFCEHVLPYLIAEPTTVEYAHEYPWTGILTKTVEPAVEPLKSGRLIVKPVGRVSTGRLSGTERFALQNIPIQSDEARRLTPELKDSIRAAARGLAREEVAYQDMLVFELEEGTDYAQVLREFEERLVVSLGFPKELLFKQQYPGKPFHGGEE